MGSEVPAAGAVTSAPVIAGDKLYFGAEDGSVYCVNKDTGEEIEKKKIGSCETHSASGRY
jgi:outer membrane protein assembly factor BamB